MSDAPFTTVIFERNVLVPASTIDLAMIAERYKPTTRLKARFSQQRSLKHHRLYWGVLRKVVETTGVWANAEGLSEAVKIHLRMFGNAIRLFDGEIRLETQSLAFDKMEQGQFKIFFEQAMSAVGEMTCLDMADVIAEVKHDMAWSSDDERAFEGRR